MSAAQLLVVNAPTLMDGMPELLHKANVEWWLSRGDHVRPLLEVLHATTHADIVATPAGVTPL